MGEPRVANLCEGAIAPGQQGGNNNTWPFNKAFYPILNLAWGGDWGGEKGVDETALPLTMEIDYVRIWQKKKE